MAGCICCRHSNTLHWRPHKPAGLPVLDGWLGGAENGVQASLRAKYACSPSHQPAHSTGKPAALPVSSITFAAHSTRMMSRFQKSHAFNSCTQQGQAYDTHAIIFFHFIDSASSSGDRTTFGCPVQQVKDWVIRCGQNHRDVHLRNPSTFNTSRARRSSLSVNATHESARCSTCSTWAARLDPAQMVLLQWARLDPAQTVLLQWARLDPAQTALLQWARLDPAHAAMGKIGPSSNGCAAMGKIGPSPNGSAGVRLTAVI